MFMHVVMWNFKPEVKEEEKEALAERMKQELLALKGQVPGLYDITFFTKPLAGSTHDLGLLTLHESEEEIASYGAHPAHVAVAKKYIMPYTCDRCCLNFEA